MGTSTSNRGQGGRTPLIPSWLDNDEIGNPPSANPVAPPTQDSNNLETAPNQPDPKRFAVPRRNFTRYTNGGGDGNLRRAASSYVRRSVGGSQNATKRLGAARSSTARLFSVVGGFASGGVRATAALYHLGDLIGKNARDAFLRIMDFVCPDGGTTDEGIARSAYIEALSTMPDWESKQIDDLTADEFLAFTEIYMANVIEERLINDIGNKVFSLPSDIAQIDNIQGQIKDFIKGSVSDAVSQLNVDIKNIDSSQTQSIVDSVYKTAFDIMSSLEGE
jgi:hypothetical protein